MQQEREQGSLYMLFGVFFTVITLVSLVSLIIVRTRAVDETSQTANIGNVGPVVVGTPVVSLTAGASHVATITVLEAPATQKLYVTAVFSDANGWQDIAEIWAFLEEAPGVQAVDKCTSANGDDCYQISMVKDMQAYPQTGGWDPAKVTCGVVDANTCTLSAYVQLTHHTDPVAYLAYAGAGDAYGAYTNDVFETPSATSTVQTLLAINIAPTLDYGTVSIGGDSLIKPLAITNSGNVIADVKAKSTDFACAVGSFPASKVTFNTTALSTSDTDFPNFDLASQTGLVATGGTTDADMKLVNVNSGQGACTATLTMNAYTSP